MEGLKPQNDLLNPEKGALWLVRFFGVCWRIR